MNISIGKVKVSSRYLPFYISCIFFLISFWGYFFYLKSVGAKYFFPASFLGDYFVLSYDLLKENFWQSVLYYHINLPFYLGYVFFFEFIFFPINGTDPIFMRGFPAYYALHTTFGILMIYSSYRLMQHFKVNKWLSCILLSIFVSTPSFYLYISQGTHDYFTMCLVTISAYLLFRALKKQTSWSYFWFFFMIALLGNVRALFHPILFLLPVIIILLISQSNFKKQIILASILPFILMMAPYVKNKIVFDKFSATSHSGRLLAQSTYEWFLHAEKDKIKLVDNGTYSEQIFCIHPPENPPIYNGVKYDMNYCRNGIWPKYGKKYLNNLGKNFDNVPILWSRRDKNNPGRIDQSNHIYYIGINEQRTKDAVTDFMTFPKHFKETFKEAWRMTFKPAISYMYGNMQNVRNLPDDLMWFSHNIWPGLDNSVGKIGSLEKRASFILTILFPSLLIFAFTIFINLRRAFSYSFFFFISLLFISIAFLIGRNGSINSWDNWDNQKKIICYIILNLSLLFIILSSFLRFVRGKIGVSSNSYCNVSRYTALYLFCTILYSTTLSAILVGTEHQRYRIYIDPLLLTLFGYWVSNIFQKANFLIVRDYIKSLKEIVYKKIIKR